MFAVSLIVVVCRWLFLMVFPDRRNCVFDRDASLLLLNSLFAVFWGRSVRPLVMSECGQRP